MPEKSRSPNNTTLFYAITYVPTEKPGVLKK